MEGLPILDPNAPFTQDSVRALDQLVASLNSANAEMRYYAEQTIKQLKDNGSLWVNADTILTYSTHDDTKFYALSALEHTINTAWNAISADQRANIKNFIVNQVIKACTETASSFYLNKLNVVLVGIVKKEWTTTWREFIPEICQASRSSQPLCENTLNVLKLLSEEIFEDQKNTMNSRKRDELKQAMTVEFSKIYELCDWVLKTAILHPGAVQNSLIKACLGTLAAFLDWVPPVHIFSGDLIALLIDSYLDNQMFRTLTLQCLSEVAGIKLNVPTTDPAYVLFSNSIVKLLTDSISKLAQALPPKSTNFLELYRNTNPQFAIQLKNYCQQLALFLLTYIQTHLPLVENFILSMKTEDSNYQQLLIMSLDGLLSYLIGLTEFPDSEIFKICCDAWHFLSKSLYEQRFQTQGYLHNQIYSLVYRDILSKARLILIPRTAKPNEVHISVDESGNVLREQLQDTEVIALYELMRETLIYLTHLDPEDMETIIMLKLAKQMDDSEWSWQTVSSLAYAIGSISGAMDEEYEKRFLVHVIKDLLALCEGKRGKENKAVVATNIMYVVMQYPRFLRKHWNFLKTVVRKLFEFMHEPHPGIKDMSCDTFLRITQTCGEEFIKLQPSADQREPFIFEIIRSINTVTTDLENHQKFEFFEALGHVINKMTNEQEIGYHLAGSLHTPQERWTKILSDVSNGLTSLQDIEVMRSLAFVLKCNESIAKSTGHFYYLHLGKIYNDMIQLYTAYSQILQNEIQVRGKEFINNAQVKSARAIRKDVLNLLQTYTKVCQMNSILTEHFIPSIIQVIIQDFVNSIPELREAEVISLVNTLIDKLGNEIMPNIPVILGPFIDSVLEMLVQDYTTFPEHRSLFFEFMKILTSRCFEGLMQLPIERFKIAVDTMIWACKHQHPSQAEIGLVTLQQVLENLQYTGSMGSIFYQHFFIYILNDILAIMTDGSHLAGFKYQCNLLRHMFMLVESGQIALPLSETLSSPAENKNFIINHLTGLFSSSFSNMNRLQIETLIIAMFNKCTNKEEFKVIIT